MCSLGKVLLLVVAMIAVALPFEKPPIAQERKSAPSATAAEPRRSNEETPFGGPPPPMRSLKGSAAVCRTQSGTCATDQAQPNGAACRCTDGNGRMTVGRVER